MDSQGLRQQVSLRRLSELLSAVYESRLLVPSSGEEPPWDDERRLKLLDAIYRGLPIGSLTVLRTTVDLEYRRAIGTVALRQLPAEEMGAARDYLVEGVGLVATLFELLGPTFLKRELQEQLHPGESSEEAPAVIVFDSQTRTFRLWRGDEMGRRSEYELKELLDLKQQYAFLSRVRYLAEEGERWWNRLKHLASAFSDFTVPVVTIASDDIEGLRSALALRGESAPSLHERYLKTSCWYCDTCGKRIGHPRDGGVEWLVRSEGSRWVGHDLRIVHVSTASPLPQGCQYDGERESARDGSLLRDVPLADFLGADGLTSLLELLERAVLPRTEVTEVIKRLHTPGYERARLHIPAAISAGIIDPSSPEGFYPQHQLRAILKWADEEGLEP
jgi:hypothetical protein